MKFITRAVTGKPPTPATRARATDDMLERLLSDGQRSAAGRAVDETSALAQVAVYACVRVIAETVASLPYLVYKRLDRGKDRATDHPLYPLLHDRANPEMTAFEWRETMVGHCLTWGHGFSEIERGRGGPVALWPLRPDRMDIQRDERDNLVYVYLLPDGEPVTFRPDQIHHWRGFGASGITGKTPISLAREAIGLGLAVEEYGARFFSNDSRPGGVLQTAGKLTADGAKRLKDGWEASMRGLSNRHRVAILEEGVTWQSIGIPPQDAQFLETRKFQIVEIARFFRVPLHLIGELERATWGNIEHQGIDFVTHTIRPWLVRIEQATARDLFGGDVRQFFAEFLVDALLRGDAVARSQALATQRQNGIITANEWREIENRNPIEGGDELLVNGNMVPVAQAGQQPEPTAPVAEATGRALALVRQLKAEAVA